MVIDCTDIKFAAPVLMSQQSATHSSYRGMNSIKVIIGVAPNAEITHVSKLYMFHLPIKPLYRSQASSIT